MKEWRMKRKKGEEEAAASWSLSSSSLWCTFSSRAHSSFLLLSILFQTFSSSFSRICSTHHFWLFLPSHQKTHRENTRKNLPHREVHRPLDSYGLCSLWRRSSSIWLKEGEEDSRGRYRHSFHEWSPRVGVAEVADEGKNDDAVRRQEGRARELKPSNQTWWRNAWSEIERMKKKKMEKERKGFFPSWFSLCCVPWSNALTAPTFSLSLSITCSTCLSSFPCTFFSSAASFQRPSISFPTFCTREKKEKNVHHEKEKAAARNKIFVVEKFAPNIIFRAVTLVSNIRTIVRISTRIPSIIQSLLLSPLLHLFLHFLSLPLSLSLADRCQSHCRRSFNNSIPFILLTQQNWNQGGGRRRVGRWRNSHPL